MTDEANPNSPRIGELLIAVGVLTSGDLTEAIQISKRMGVPIGRVLVMSGCVTEGNLQNALELQSLIKDKQVDHDTGIKALKLVFSQSMTLDTALRTLNWTPNRDSAGNKLGDLLVDSSIVSRGQLERALESSFQSGMPLGGTLVLQGVISPMLLPTVLHIQESIRDGLLNRDEAIAELKRALMFWARAGQSKEEGGELQASRPTTADGGFSSRASAGADGGFPSRAQAEQFAVRESPPAPTAAPMRQNVLLPPPGAPSKNSQPGAVELAMAPANTALTNSQPASVPQATFPAGLPAAPNIVSLVELLELSGHCNKQSISQAIADALADNRLASKLLLAIGVLDGDTLNTYVKCQAYIARGILRTDQVLYLLNAMRQRKIGFEQAAQEMGLTLPE